MPKSSVVLEAQCGLLFPTEAAVHPDFYPWCTPQGRTRASVFGVHATLGSRSGLGGQTVTAADSRVKAAPVQSLGGWDLSCLTLRGAEFLSMLCSSLPFPAPLLTFSPAQVSFESSADSMASPPSLEPPLLREVEASDNPPNLADPSDEAIHNQETFLVEKAAVKVS